MPATRLLLKRTLITVVASLVILAGLLVGGVRLLDRIAPEYRQALADRIGSRIDADVTIDHIELRWQWRGPLLDLGGVSVRRHGEDSPAVTLDNLGLHFSFMDLVHGRRMPDALVLDAPRLAVRFEDQRLRLVHWTRDDDKPLGWPRIQSLRDSIHRVRIDDARIDVRQPRLPDGHVTFDDVDATLDDVDGRLSWQLAASARNAFDQLDSEGTLTGPLPDFRRADATLSISGVPGLTLARVTGLLDDATDARLEGGDLGATVEAHWRDRAFTSGQAQLAVTAIDAADDGRTLIPATDARLRAVGSDTDDTVRVVLENIDSALAGLDDLVLTGTLDPAARQLRLDARHLPVDPLVRIARLKYPRLADTDIDADIGNLSLTAGLDAPLKLALAFNDLRIDDPRVRAGPLSGSFYRQGDTHVLTFAGDKARLESQRYLRGELALDALDGELSWRRRDNAWSIDAQRLHLSSGEAELDAKGLVTVPDNGAPSVDLRADFSAPDVPRLLAHIPQAPDLPNDKLRDWLPKAITAGRLTAGHLALSGPLDRFPFAQPREGERFHLELDGEGVDMIYKPDWPPLHQAAGKLILDGNDLSIQVAHGQVLDVDVAASTGRVANVREPVLQLDGHVRNAPADKMLQFLTDSPLHERFDKLLQVIDLTGPADLDLDLAIPLKPELGDPEVSGRVHARGNTLELDALPGPITRITGDVRFDEHNLHAQGLNGQLLGVPISVDLGPGSDGAQRIVGHAHVILPDDADALAHYLPRPWLDYARGASDASVALQVGDDGAVSEIAIDSDLAGTRLDLPAPLHKAASQRAPLDIRVQPDGDRVRVRYDDRLTVNLRLADGTPTRVQALFGDAGPTPPDRDGVWIGGHTDELDGLGWFYVVNDLLDEAAQQPGGGDSIDFIGGDVRADALHLDQRIIDDTHLRAHPLADQYGWRIDLEGPNTQGQVTWTQPRGGRVSIQGSLARLALRTRDAPAAEEGQQSTSPVMWPDLSPLDMPRLDIRVDRLQVDDTDLGRADVQAAALPDGWQLDRFTLADGDLVGWATGRWLRHAGMDQASAQTRLEGHGLAGLLRTLGYTPAITAKTAHLHSRLAIAPNPNGLDLRSLDGSVQLALDKGTLTSVEPGAARVLGLVNLYVLPRRLELDFRDVVDEGLAFDSVRAHFRIENGNAYGDDVRIETPSSTIAVEGRLGLAARDYDERVTVTPKLGGGATIAGTVLGGPLVGAAVFAAQEIFKQPIRKFSSVRYTLKGSWDDPQITQPDAEPAADQDSGPQHEPRPHDFN